MVFQTFVLKNQACSDWLKFFQTFVILDICNNNPVGTVIGTIIGTWNMASSWGLQVWPWPGNRSSHTSSQFRSLVERVKLPFVRVRFPVRMQFFPKGDKRQWSMSFYVRQRGLFRVSSVKYIINSHRCVFVENLSRISCVAKALSNAAEDCVGYIWMNQSVNPTRRTALEYGSKKFWSKLLTKVHLYIGEQFI